MDLESTFHRLLGLDEGWRVLRASYDDVQGRFEIHVAETPKLWEQESARLNGEVRCYDHVPRMEWRHLNVFNKESVILCDLPRGHYLDRRESLNGTLKVYRVTPPWEGRSKHFTQDFEAFALTLMREMPVKRAGEILGETDQRLWRMLQTHVDAAYQKLEMDDVVWVGADEMNRRKGHNYLTVFADLKAKRVVFATEGKDASTWEAFADELLKHNGHPKAVLQAAIDMSPAYVKGVRENLGNAQIVFDKFHVVSDVNQAVDKVRRAESQSCASAGASLTKTRWL